MCLISDICYSILYLVLVVVLSVHHVPMSVGSVNLFGPVSSLSIAIAISLDIVVVVTVVTIVILASVLIVPPVNVYYPRTSRELFCL